MAAMMETDEDAELAMLGSEEDDERCDRARPLRRECAEVHSSAGSLARSPDSGRP